MKHYNDYKMRLNAFPVLSILFFSFLFMSCYSDDSTTWEKEVGTIAISGMDSRYTRTSLVGEHLVINPTVDTGYSDSELEYSWVLVNGKTGTKDEHGKTIEPDTICREKNLDYEINLAPGDYQVRLYIRSKTNNYTATSFAVLVVQTELSQGFYILKENAEGNTELDMVNEKYIFNLDEEVKVSEDLLEKIKGQSMKGKPLNLCPHYNMPYVEETSLKPTTCASLTVSSEANEFYVLRTTDLATVFDRNTLFFEPAPADEVALGMHPDLMSQTILITTKGVYANSGSGSTGIMGMPKFEGSFSTYYYYDPASYGGGGLWDSSSHSIVWADRSQKRSLVSDVTSNLTSYDCLYCGYSQLSNTASNSEGKFILRDRNTGERHLYMIKGTLSGKSLTKSAVFASGSHMSKTDFYATNCRTAAYIYCIDGGKIYACVTNSENLDEVEITPLGIPSDETINYLVNQFWYSRLGIGTQFNYLIVGTQSGNTYKLYFYEMVGGTPSGAPFKTVQGTGKVKMVRYVGPNYRNTDLSQRYCYSMTN